MNKYRGPAIVVLGVLGVLAALALIAVAIDWIAGPLLDAMAGR